MQSNEKVESKVSLSNKGTLEVLKLLELLDAICATQIIAEKCDQPYHVHVLETEVDMVKESIINITKEI